MRKALVFIVAGIFAIGNVGSAAGQSATPPAPKPAEKTDAKTSDKPAAKKPAAKSASGQLKSASPDAIVVAGKDKGKAAEWTFAIDADTKITRDGKAIASADLKAGDDVRVRFTEQGGKATAQVVMVRPTQAPKKTGAGTAAETPAAKK